MMRPRLVYILLASLCLGLASFPPTAASFREGKDFAIFFPVNEYEDQGWDDLRNPIRDAEALAKELEAVYGFQPRIYPNKSQEEIFKILLQWQKKTDFAKDAQLFVFFSGHGTFDEAFKKGYFIPQEGKASDLLHKSHLELTTIGNLVSQINCPHILLAIDACYSGTIDQAIAFKGRPTAGRMGDSPETKQMRRISEQLRNRSRLLLTSGEKERTPDGKEHSPFTLGFLKALRQTEIMEDNLLTYRYLLSVLENVTPRPHEGELPGHNGGGFVFVRKGNIPPPPPASNLQGDYLAAVNCGTISCLETFLDKYSNPNNPFVQAAQIQLLDLKQKALDLPFGPKMVFIQGGTFEMGSTEGSKDEKPIHKVRISNFYLAETEVTNAQFCAFLNEKGNQEEGWGTWLEMSEYVQIEKKGQQYVPKSGMAAHPVVKVSWYGAVAYCKWLSEKTKLTYRLPTEAEWEYAAGGGSISRTKWAGTNAENTLHLFGNFCDQNCRYGWKDNTQNDGYAQTAPVRSFSPNGLALYDMSGNVWEWCSDWYGSDYYANCEKQGTVLNPQSPSSGSFRVYRGGCWYNLAFYLRVSYRYYCYPEGRYDYLGFRPARTGP